MFVPFNEKEFDFLNNELYKLVSHLVKHFVFHLETLADVLRKKILKEKLASNEIDYFLEGTDFKFRLEINN